MSPLSFLISLLVLVTIMTCFNVISGSDLVYRTCNHDSPQHGKNNITSQQLIKQFLTKITTELKPNQIYNNFTLLSSGTSGPAVRLYGQYQCRGDLVGLRYPMCRACLVQAAAMLRAGCPNRHDGAIQMDKCFVKYDFTYIFGVQDLLSTLTECWTPANGTDIIIARDVVLRRMVEGREAYFRHANAGNVEGVAQCLEDLTSSQCQECLLVAIRWLAKNGCKAGATLGSFYTSKCYAKFNVHGSDKGGSSSNINITKGNKL